MLQRARLRENRFGFEPEIIAEIARLHLRVYEMGISYAGRTYEEGKKIGAMDGLRALYCIVRDNMPHAPVPIQLMGYLNYWLCIVFLFRHLVRWSAKGDLAAYTGVVLFGAAIDLVATLALLQVGTRPWLAKLVASAVALGANFLGSRVIVFPECPTGPWAKSRVP